MHKIAKLAHKIEQLDICVRRLALQELSCWAFLLGPVGIDEGKSMSGRLELLLGGARFLQGMGLRPTGAVLSGGRMEDRGRVRARGQKPGRGRADSCPGAGSGPGGKAQRDTD